MRYLFIILLLICGLVCKAQDTIKAIEGRLPGFFSKPRDIYAPQGNEPLIFADSIKVDYAYLQSINVNEIETINIEKKANNNGALYVKFKNHNYVLHLINDKLLSLRDITKAHIANAKKPIIYLIDDNLINDTTGIRIPSKHIIKVTVMPAAESPYFKTALPDVLFMNIITKEPDVYIR